MEQGVIVGEASTTVQASPEEVIEFVLDLDRYRQADHKIGKVKAIERDGDSGTFTFVGKIRGLPGPSGTYPFRVTGNRLEVGSPTAGPARWFLSSFEGTFVCEPTADGTFVTHREAFGFRKPWSWIAGPLLRSWLENDTADEMRRLGELVDESPPST